MPNGNAMKPKKQVVDDRAAKKAKADALRGKPAQGNATMGDLHDALDALGRP